MKTVKIYPFITEKVNEETRFVCSEVKGMTQSCGKWTLPLIIIIAMMLSACVPQSGGGGSRRSTSSTFAASGDDTSTVTTFYNTAALYFYSQGASVTNLLIDSNNLINVELRGTEVENYLKESTNADQKYCMVITFTGTDKAQLRARAIPQSRLLSGVLERYLRIDLAEESLNETNCPDAGFTNPTLAYSAEDVCTNCSSIIQASGISLYLAYDNGATRYMTNSEISGGTPDINLSALTFKINPYDNTGDPGDSCTSTECVAQGYDCCLNGQCVTDNTLKPGVPASGDEQEFALAQAAIQSHWWQYINYPQFYYVCPGTQAPTPTPTATIDPEDVANRIFLAQVMDYLCLTCSDNSSHADCTASGVTTSVSSPVVFAASCGFTGYDPDGDGTAETSVDYAKVYENVYTKGGCTGDATSCAGYTVAATKDETGKITSLTYVSPSPNADPTPFQVLDKNVSARTAPHRFFDSSGDAIDNIATATTTPTQEGTAFQYLDATTKMIPQNGTFNMNSIIGQFALSLDQAKPAQVIDVVLDETYILSATTGVYTFCSNCARDSWYNLFTANPNSQMGKGLQGLSHTVSRDVASTNISYGNYEDTIFGRACFIPPTMIPFSHSPCESGTTPGSCTTTYSSVQDQRQARLGTQAAFFVNGYQRDWYGFNKGALIGSFDGVKWFAIGKGRRIKATTRKLFLAINAPFADLATSSSFNVHIIVDNHSSNVAADYDYDPSKPWNHPEQTEAASCRKFHMCEKDSDCISQLGWEYSCAQFTSYRTLWPDFDAEAQEENGSSYAVKSLVQILTGGVLPPASTAFPNGRLKRCVYRGAGAPCLTDPTITSDTSLEKMMTCAPNFHCAKLSDSVYNQEVARFATDLSDLFLAPNHMFGQDAYQMGRPLNYIANKSLNSTIIKNIQANAKSLNLDITKIGMCRPGKDVSSNNLKTQHTAASTATDYISQIGTCDPTGANATARIQGCPVLNSDGNYIPLSSSATASNSLALSQNSCGGEAKDSGSNLAFELIEKTTLSALGASSIIEPTLARNACLRRAGAICHTNLDCGPNKMHAGIVDLKGDAYFGNNLAERKYWEEYLVCGQSQPIPSIYDIDFDQYNMRLNRCCREVGKDITLYSEDHTSQTANSEDNSLVADRLSANAPSTDNRYSRYQILEGFPSNTYPVPAAPSLAIGVETHQWKTISKTAQRTCCGGGFVRKFADGSHDWTKTDRLQFDISNFRCMNYLNKIVEEDVFSSPSYDDEYDRLCRAVSGSDNFFCSQLKYQETTSNLERDPKDVDYTVDGSNNATNIIIFSHEKYPRASLWRFGSGSKVVDDSSDIRYLLPYRMTHGTDDNLPGGDGNERKTHFVAGATSGVIYLNWPAYLPAPVFSGGGINTYIRVKSMAPNESDGKFYPTSSGTHVRDACGNGVAENPVDIDGDGNAESINCSYTYSNGVLAVTMVSTALPYDATVEVEFNGDLSRFTGLTSGKMPGNDLYYLNKLGTLELLGIPQVTYKPFECSWDKTEVVPGIYNSSVSVTDTVYQSSVEKDPIFSDHEFSCCVQLGEKTSSASQCCSNYAVTDTTGDVEVKYCKLPPGTNLNVYYNPFVSGEWLREDLPVTFNDSDFDSQTGEVTIAAASKLKTLAARVCSSTQYRTGDAFGNYYPEPTPSNIYGTPSEFIAWSIVDSYADVDIEDPQDHGVHMFAAGFRWNHHIYCDVESN